MKQKLTGISYYRAIIARWIVINIAFRISRLGTISLCLELSKLYTDQIEVNNNE